MSSPNTYLHIIEIIENIECNEEVKSVMSQQRLVTFIEASMYISACGNGISPSLFFFFFLEIVHHGMFSRPP